MSDTPLRDERGPDNAPDGGGGCPWRTAFVEGVSLWAPSLPGWTQAEAALGGKGSNAAAAGGEAPAARPSPCGLAANERRRAPDSVLAALQVAEEAVAQSGRNAATLASVFTSAHGDLPILDAMLRTLAREPQLLSPMRFHHSVHNAPSGYWAIASGSHAASTALAAFDHSFAAGLLEGLVQVATGHEPVLVVGCDTGAVGPLASVNASRGLLGLALVLAPQPGPQARHALHWRTTARAEPRGASEAPAAAAGPDEAGRGTVAALRRNAQADGLPLFEALAAHRPCNVGLACGARLTLELQVRPRGRAG